MPPKIKTPKPLKKISPHPGLARKETVSLSARQEFLPQLPWDPERKKGGAGRTQTSRLGPDLKGRDCFNPYTVIAHRGGSHFEPWFLPLWNTFLITRRPGRCRH